MLMKNAKISTQKNILRQQNVIFNPNILSSDFFNSKNTRKEIRSIFKFKKHIENEEENENS